MNRRDFIRGLGKAICAGASVPFIPSLLDLSIPLDAPLYAPASTSTSKTFAAMLEEYYTDSLLQEELVKREWVLNSKLIKGEPWVGANNLKVDLE